MTKHNKTAASMEKPAITVGLDLGDRFIQYCMLNREPKSSSDNVIRRSMPDLIARSWKALAESIEKSIFPVVGGESFLIGCHNLVGKLSLAHDAGQRQFHESGAVLRKSPGLPKAMVQDFLPAKCREEIPLV